MTQEFHHQQFASILEAHGKNLNQEQLSQFEIYANLLQEWNKKMNLTAIVDLDGIYEKHFLDSLLPSFDFKIEGSLCDVGAGAGFPSIPLKILYPDLKVTIVEPLGKRVTFLKELCSQLNLHDVILCNERSEDHALHKRESYDIVTARAVANLVMLSELCVPLVKPNGFFLAMKGDRGFEEIDEAKFAIKTLGCELQDTYQKKLSDDSTRINFVFKKVKSAPRKYPRKFALIKKSPLRGGKL